MGVNYEDMPEVLIDTLFPKHFGLPVGEKETERVLAQFGVYSKRMKRVDPKEAKDDSAEKEKEASLEVHQAVELFLHDSYEKLQLMKNKDFIPTFHRQLTKRVDVAEAVDSADIILYNPQVALQNRQLQATVTFCNVTSAVICCPLGSTR